MQSDHFDELLLTYLRGDLSPEQRLELAYALQSNPERRAEKRVLERLWLGLAFAVPEVDPLPGHRERFWGRLH